MNATRICRRCEWASAEYKEWFRHDPWCEVAKRQRRRDVLVVVFALVAVGAIVAAVLLP